ncbi:MAG: glycosyltransferase family 2 protein [Promethearchaeota archaeon]
MNPDAPSITVLIPCRNCAHTLRRALDSIFSQTQPPQKIIVVDDKSTDDSLAIIQSYKRKYPSMFLIIYGPGQGAGAARQAGLAGVNTEYVALLDSDDWYAPNALEILYKHVHVTGAACGSISKIYSNGHERVQQQPADKDCLITHRVIRKANYLPMSSVMYRTAILRQVGGFDEKLVRMEDLDLHLRVSRITDYYFTTNVIAYYTTPDQQNLREKTFTYAKWEAIVWRKHGFVYWGALLRAFGYFVINTILIPINLIRKLAHKKSPIFRDVYARILIGYIIGLMTGYRFQSKK